MLLATMIWGVAFVAQTAASDAIGSFTFNAARSWIAAILLCAVVLTKEKITVKRAAEEKRKSLKEERKNTVKKSLVAGVWCGIALFAAVNFQQFGMEKYPEGVSSSGRAGFLTATYVVIVAAYTAIRRKKIHPLTALSCVGCLAGMYLLCMSGGISAIYLGDVLELLGAVSFAVQILLVDKYTSFDGVALSCAQFTATALLSTLCAAFFETVRFSDLLSAWLPVLYTGVLSSCVGYTFQILGQKSVKPAVACVLMSLESVFAALAGWIILKETLSAAELIGCALVFVSVVLSQFVPTGEEEKGLSAGGKTQSVEPQNAENADCAKAEECIEAER